MSNGSDGPTSSMGLFGGWAANERGYHWMTVDGPGQQARPACSCTGFRSGTTGRRC